LISRYNPSSISKIASILQSGSVENKKFLVYDAHVPYKLQFFIENNLYGMGYIHFKNMLFRYPLPMITKEEQNPKGIFKETTSENFILPPKVLKISSCPLEIDINAVGKKWIDSQRHFEQIHSQQN
jgi:hypothetical protein